MSGWRDWPGSTGEYGAEHRQRRASLLARYEREGRGWPCFLCDQPMTDPPRLLDLAHLRDRSDPRRLWAPSGLAHRRCNRGDSLRLGNQRRAVSYDPQPTPRTRW